MEQSVTYEGANRTEVSDEALMAQVKAGDEGALAALICRYEKPLFNYALRMLGNAADAEDLFQETFLRVYQHRSRFWEGAPFKRWLYRIATNLCYDRLRYRKRRPESQSMPGTEQTDPMALHPASTPTPDVSAISLERAEHMKRALAALSDHHRAVFLMAHQQGLSYADISLALGIPVGTVKSRMNKAVKLLMTAMEAIE